MHDLLLGVLVICYCLTYQWLKKKHNQFFVSSHGICWSGIRGGLGWMSLEQGQLQSYAPPGAGGPTSKVAPLTQLASCCWLLMGDSVPF